MGRAIRIGLTVATITVAAALIVVVAAIAFVAMPWILLALGTTFDDLPARPPLARLRVMRQDGQTTEIHATLARGCRLEDSVDVRIFDGFETALTRERGGAAPGTAEGPVEGATDQGGRVRRVVRVGGRGRARPVLRPAGGEG